MSHAPDIQDQIYEEVKEMGVYDPDNLASAVTLNRVLEETLRLTPALYFFPRRATVDTWIEHGPRFCPGRFLGLLEVGLVVGAVVKMFKFTAVGEGTQAKAGVSTKPADGVLVDLELRT